MAMVFQTDGTSYELDLQAEADPFGKVEEIVGGWAEPVKTKAGEMYVHGDGKSQGLLLNPRATELAGSDVAGSAVILTHEKFVAYDPE